MKLSNKYVYYFGFPVLCLLSFSCIVFWFSGGEISRVNYWRFQVEWFTEINQTLSHLDVLFENLTQLGDALILLPIISFLIIWRPQIWAGFFGAIPLGVLLSAGGKYLAAVPRPGVVLDPTIYTAVGSMKGFHSLPSGHTLTIFAMMAIILLVLIPTPKSKIHYGLLICGFLIAALIAISRVAVGVHWPLDLVAGAGLGYLAGVSGVILTQRYRRWWFWLMAEKYQFIFAAIMLAWSLGLFKRLFKQSDNTDIVIWIAALSGLMTALYLLKQSALYYLKDTLAPDDLDETSSSLTQGK